MNCPNCGSENIEFIANTQSKNRSCLSWILMFLLFFFTLGIGLIFWIIMLATNKKTITKTRAICRNCGHQWDV